MNEAELMVQKMRRDVLSKGTEDAGLRRLFMWGFLALYVLSATASQLTVVVLLNYLLATA